MTPATAAHDLLAVLELELRLRLRSEGYGEAPRPPWIDDFDDALARRPVIRDQGPPPVRRQPAPRPMRPPPRRLSWLVEGRGR